MSNPYTPPNSTELQGEPQRNEPLKSPLDNPWAVVVLMVSVILIAQLLRVSAASANVAQLPNLRHTLFLCLDTNVIRIVMLAAATSSWKQMTMT